MSEQTTTSIDTTIISEQNVLPQDVSLDNALLTQEKTFNGSFSFSDPSSGSLQTINAYRNSEVETQKVIHHAQEIASIVKGQEIDSFSPEYRRVLEQIRAVGAQKLEDSVKENSPLLRGRAIVQQSSRNNKEMGDNLLSLNRSLEAINNDLANTQKSLLAKIMPKYLHRQIEERTKSKDEAIAQLKEYAENNYRRSIETDAQLQVVTEDYRDDIAALASEMRLLWEIDKSLVTQLEEESGGDAQKREELFNSKYARLIATTRTRYNNISMNVISGTINLIMFSNAHRNNEKVIDIAENAKTFGVSNIYGAEIVDSVLQATDEILDTADNINQYAMKRLQNNVTRSKEITERSRQMAMSNSSDIEAVGRAMNDALATAKSLTTEWQELAKAEDMKKSQIQNIIDKTQAQIRELSLEMPQEAKTMLEIESE